MSKIFNHTIQPLGSTTSPVEDLALEVEDAFTSIEKSIDVSKTVITNFGDTFGNPTFESLGGHGVNKSTSEVHNMLPSESNIILKNIPNTGTLTLSYTDPNTGSTVNLKEVPYDQDFTDKDQFKISGKYVVLNIRVPNTKSVAVNATYSTKTFTLGGKKFLSNVVTKDDGTFELKPESLGSNSYALNYETSIKNNPEKHFNKTLKFFMREDYSEEYRKLNVTGYTFEDNRITFSSTELPTNISNVKVLAFAQNTDISTLLNALYKEFREHSHSNSDMSENINTSHLTNRFVNTDKISYKDDNVTNYLFPQYFNREGYNPDLDAVYENSILGDVFISRVISDTVQKYKGLDADSNSLIFGDPVRGHKIKYSRQDEALVLNTIMPMNGLKVVVNDDDKYGIGINDSTLKSNSEGLSINPQEETFNVKSKDTSKKYTSNFDKVVVDEAVLKNTTATKISINKVDIEAHTDNESVLVSSKDNTKKVIFSTPVEAEKIIVNSLVSPNEVTFKALNTGWAKFGDIHYKLNNDKDLVISDEGDPKERKIVYKLPTKFDGRMHAHHISPNTINFGNMVFNVDDATLGLNVFSTKPDQSTVKFVTGLEYSVGKGNLQVGDVHVQKNALSGSVTVSSQLPVTEMLFNVKTRFKELKTDNDSNVNIYKANFDKAFFGKTKLEKENDVLHIKHSASADPTGKVEVEVPINLQNATYNNLTGPAGSQATMDRLEVSTLSIGGILISNNGSLVPSTPSPPGTPTPPIPPGSTVTPSTPGATLSFAAKLEADEFSAKNASIDTLVTKAMDAKAVKIGNGTFAPDTNLHVTLTSTVNGTKFKVALDSEFNNLLASNLTSPKATITHGILEKLNIGDVSFVKSDDDVEVTRTSTNGVFKLNMPVEAQDFVATNFGTTNDATMKNIYGSTITVNGMTWSSNKEGHTTISSKDTEKKYIFDVPVVFSNSRNTLTSSSNYQLLPGDKISVNADNYITNYNGKFAAKMSKGFTYVGSGKDTGIKFALEEDSLATLKQYIASNAGAVATENEKNAFVEADVTDGIYFLQSTSKKIQSKGTVFGFNDPTAPRNIADLRKWLRAPLFSGPIEADSIKLAMVEEGTRNGISIGETRISVIGPNTECPTGLTTFESAEGIHFVSPLAKENTCRDLTYQEVNVGPLSIKGDGSAENSFTITEDLMVGGTASAAFLDITDQAAVNKLKVAEDVSVAGKAEFKNSISVANNIETSGNVVAKGDVEAQNFRVARDTEVARDLRVANDAYVTGDVVIEGSLSLTKGFQTVGLVKSVGVETENLKANVGEILTNFKVAGEHSVGGKLKVTASATVEGSLYAKGNAEVSESLVAKDLYSVKDTTVREKLTVLGGTELTGATINIGSDTSKIQMNGKLSINTDVFSVNAPTKIFSTLKVSEDAEFASRIQAKAGISVDSGIQAKGVISTESNVEVGSVLSAKSVEVAQDLRVGSSLISNSLTAESLVIQQRASINNLTISGSLSMPTDTTIVVGDIKANSFTQTNVGATSTFAGPLYLGKKLEVASDVQVNGSLYFDNGEFQLTSLGVKGKDAIVDVNKVRAELITGTNKIQPPPNLMTSGNAAAAAVSGIISSSTNYIRQENSLFEGITVFAQPIVANTIYYTDLVQVKESVGGAVNNSIDLTARRALYA